MQYKALRPRAYFQTEACAVRVLESLKRRGHHAMMFGNMMSGGYTVLWV
jgi:hypothetical protein